MNLSTLKKLFQPLTEQFRKDVEIPTPSGTMVFTLRVPSAEVDAEVAQQQAEFINNLLKEYTQFVTVGSDGTVKLKFDPTIAEILQRRMDASLEAMRSHHERVRLSYVIVAINRQEIPAVIDDGDSRRERHEVIYDILSELPSGLSETLLVEYRELVLRSTLSYVSDSNTQGDLDSEIEILKQQVADVESKKVREISRVRQQAEEVAQGTRADLKPSGDEEAIPQELVFQFEEAKKQAAAPKPVPAPPKPEPRKSLAESVEIKPAPVHEPPKEVVPSITENGVEIPVYSIGDHVITGQEGPSEAPKPAPARHSINPRFRPVPGKLNRG